MSSQSQKVAVPACLPKRLEAFRIGAGMSQRYLVRDKLAGKSYDFEPWQFFVLEVLPGCEDFAKLASVFQDRFGSPLEKEALDQLFASIADNKLIDDSADHPLLAPFRTQRYETDGGKARVKSFRAALQESAPPKADSTPVTAAPAATAPATVTAGEQELPAGVQDAVGLDERAVKKIWHLFDPRAMLKLHSPWVAQLKHAVYVIPVLGFFAAGIVVRYSHLVRQDMDRLLGAISFFEHLVFSLFTVNLAVTLASAFVAHLYRANVTSVGVALFYGFLPRFTTRISHTEQLSRRERIWLHAAPLMMRVVLFSLGVLIWYGARDSNGLLAQFGLSLGVVGAASLLVSSNPLVKGSGYHLLSAFMNEPHLRGKSYKALLSRMKGGVYKEADEGFLEAYALASLSFMLVAMVVAVVVLGLWLKQAQLGGSAIILTVMLGTFLYRRTTARMRKIQAAYERSVQFERWRKRTLPAEKGEADGATAPEVSAWNKYLRRAGLVAAVTVPLLPYSYETGGRFVVYPAQKETLSTDVAGTIQSVFYDGGEWVAKGTVIARLGTEDYQSQVDVYTGKMAEQRAIIEDLKARPKPEEVRLAESSLKVAETQERFSREKLERTANLYKDGAVSLEEYADAMKTHDVDAGQVIEKRAALDLVKAGATDEEVAAAEAKWRSLRDERDMYKDKIRRTELVMPFDGTLLTLHLKQKANSYLEQGQPFAAVENSGAVTVEIEVPESDVGHVVVSAPVRARPNAFDGELFAGKVAAIDGNVTSQSFGNVVKVVALVENQDGRLKTGMTGYAKVAGQTMPVWKAFSTGLQRFFMIEVWSWIP